MRLANTLCTNGFKLSVAIYGNKFDRKDASLQDLRVFDAIKVMQVAGVEPDVLAQDAAKSFQAVIFDSCDTESIYSHSFHLYAKKLPKILDIFQLKGTESVRKAMFNQGQDHLTISKAQPTGEVDRQLTLGGHFRL